MRPNHVRANALTSRRSGKSYERGAVMKRCSLLVFGAALMACVGCSAMHYEAVMADGSRVSGSYTRLGSQELSGVDVEPRNDGMMRMHIDGQKSSSEELNNVIQALIKGVIAAYAAQNPAGAVSAP